MCRRCGCYHTSSSSQHAEYELPSRPVPSERPLPSEEERDQLRKDKAKRDREAVRRGSTPSFGTQWFEQEPEDGSYMAMSHKIEERKRAEEEHAERERAQRQRAEEERVELKRAEEEHAQRQRAHGQRAHGQRAHGQRAHGQRQLEQQDQIGRAY
ncbi:MAG: hypothetical protein LQ339_002431 [Xanthoria mediterranea]|nr:MAG: hypothetical protein LQ339_002431 [Xanthoria mediterranea]